MNKEYKYFSIRELEHFSGVKAHTIRIWERRYGLLHPERTDSNFRLYTLEELKKLLNIALLNRNGHRIAGLSKADSATIESIVKRLLCDDDKWQIAINELTVNMYAVDPGSFEWILDELLMQWPIDTLVEKIMYPFLTLTRLLWKGNKLSEEHMVVTAIRKKLIYAIQTTPAKRSGKMVILFLPDSKQLDLGLLFTNYYLQKRGINVLYLGNDVSVSNLKSIFYVKPPALLFTYLPSNHLFNVDAVVKVMTEISSPATLVIGKYNEFSYSYDTEKVKILEFEDALTWMSAYMLDIYDTKQ